MLAQGLAHFESRADAPQRSANLDDPQGRIHGQMEGKQQMQLLRGQADA
jgi:hypothetical protein